MAANSKTKSDYRIHIKRYITKKKLPLYYLLIKKQYTDTLQISEKKRVFIALLNY